MYRQRGMVYPSGGWVLPVRCRTPWSSGVKYDPSKNDVSALCSDDSFRLVCPGWPAPDVATRGLLFAAGGAGMSCTRWSRDCTAVVELSRAGIFCTLLSVSVLLCLPPPYPCLKKYGPFRLLNIEPVCGANGTFCGRVYPDPERQIGSFCMFAISIQHIALQCCFMPPYKVFQWHVFDDCRNS